MILLDYNKYNEALKLSDYKKFQHIIGKNNHNEFKDYFDSFPDKSRNGYRIYLPIDIVNKKPWDDQVRCFLEDNGYYITYDNYIKGICYKQEIRPGGSHIQWDRPLKIGRVLMKLDNDDIYKRYIEDSARQLKNDKFMVVISRHFYDILGMSTDRGWTSCHDIYDRKYNGHYHYQMEGIIKGGALIAYLIRENDKNIKNPISRLTILIYKHKDNINIINPNDENPHKNKYLLIPESHVYGFNSKEFYNFVEQWCEEYNEKYYDGGGSYFSYHQYTGRNKRISR